jgi:hypothetical protein
MQCERMLFTWNIPLFFIFPAFVATILMSEYHKDIQSMTLIFIPLVQGSICVSKYDD